MIFFEYPHLVYSMKTDVAFDAAPIGKTFGAVLVDVNTNWPYQAGQIVSVQFVGANPRVSRAAASIKEVSP